jgi:methylmalonyl-CoA mutase
MPKQAIEQAAAARQARVDRGEEVVVGVNRYRPATEETIEILAIDNAKVRQGQIERLARVRSGRDEARCRAALDALREGARGDGNLLALSVEAARARATLGEISSALEDVFGRHAATVRLVKGVYGESFGTDPGFARVVEGIEAFERRKGRRPRVLVAKMGQDGHDRGAKVVGSAFADLGFDVTVGPLFQKPEETAALAIELDVDVVGASSLAAGHNTLVPELLSHLRTLGRGDIRVVAGGVIPAQDYDLLRAAGTAAIFGPGTNIVEAGADILRLLGHNMPPEGLDEAAE